MSVNRDQIRQFIQEAAEAADAEPTHPNATVRTGKAAIGRLCVDAYKQVTGKKFVVSYDNKTKKYISIKIASTHLNELQLPKFIEIIKSDPEYGHRFLRVVNAMVNHSDEYSSHKVVIRFTQN